MARTAITSNLPSIQSSSGAGAAATSNLPSIQSSSGSCQGIARLPLAPSIHCMSFLALSTLGTSCRVSKSWQAAIDGPSGQPLWRELSIKDGVPLVEFIENRDTNYKAEFRFLRAITLSGRRIGRSLDGTVLGIAPRIRLDIFLKLKDQQDSFEPARHMSETFVVLMDYPLIEITLDPVNRPLALDKAGNLIVVPNTDPAVVARSKLQVPLSLENIRMLSTYRTAGMRNTRTFDSSSYKPVFKQCGPATDQTGISIQRRQVPDATRNLPFDGSRGQVKMMEGHGFEAVDIRKRALFDHVAIQETGTCPDIKIPVTFNIVSSLTYVRCPDVVDKEEVYNGKVCNDKATIGGYLPGEGVHVFKDVFLGNKDNHFVGVVPSAPAGSS